MRLLSWTSLCMLSSVLCTNCLAQASCDLVNSYAIQRLDRLERRQDDSEDAPSTILKNPVPAATTVDGNPRSSATPAPKKSSSGKTSATGKTSAAGKTSVAGKTSAAPTRTSAPTTKQQSTSSRPESSQESTSLTTTSSLTSSRSSSTSSTNIPQPTSILSPQPQSASHVSIGGIVAGVILGAAVLGGMAWIALAKWRENRRHRAQFGDDESKHGFAAAGAGGHFLSSQDSLLAGGKPAKAANGLRLKALSPSSRAHSFISSLHNRPTSQIPQDVLPPPSPAEHKGLPELPRAEHQFSTPLGSHPHIAELPSPQGVLPPAGPLVGRSVQRKPLPQVNHASPVRAQRSPSAYQLNSAAELPG